MSKRTHTRTSSASKHVAAYTSSLRIIGGEWRGRRLQIIDAPGVRPTSDRIRETLFNWLAPIIEGARCLDLFAGTGVLGIEALSRGAAHSLFMEQLPAAARALDVAIDELGAGDKAVVQRANALASPLGGPFDVVFIDPPFADDLHARAIKTVKPLLSKSARVYMEYPIGQRNAMHDLLKDGFEILREKKAGQVGFCLARPVQRTG